jgi:hypothetical protein
MESAARLTFAWKLSVLMAVLFCWVSTLPTAAAQGSAGQDAVYNSSGNTAGSSSFIDASQFANKPSSRDFCSVLNYVLVQVVQPNYPNGVVIDARGLPGNTGTSLTCAAGTTPWSTNGNTNIVNVPSTILLPATGGTSPTPIVISTPWILPSGTHLIGEGDNTTNGSAGTTIQAAQGNSMPEMIQFGSSSVSVCPSGVCGGISVERLTLDGQAQAVDGIVNEFSQGSTANQFSQGATYVDHVTIYQVLGAELENRA